MFLRDLIYRISDFIRICQTLVQNLFLHFTNYLGGFLRTDRISQITGCNQFFHRSFLLALVQLLSAGSLICHNNTSQCACSWYFKRAGCDNIAVLHTGGCQRTCDHCTCYKVQVRCLYLDSAGIGRFYVCAAVCCVADLFSCCDTFHIFYFIRMCYNNGSYLVRRSTKILVHCISLLCSKILT